MAELQCIWLVKTGGKHVTIGGFYGQNPVRAKIQRATVRRFGLWFPFRAAIEQIVCADGTLLRAHQAAAHFERAEGVRRTCAARRIFSLRQ
ncbi:hypothetical protein KCP77_24485 [Salmonella enterica subsp. enterica]|nr:hypothetical protein KCP77_24485 [Salmonella enterica subsp. enterica]